MAFALVSDIHSNLQFFKKILDKIEGLGIKEIYCLGDLVGYYDCPNEVIDLVRTFGIKTLKGNHERFLLNEIPFDETREKIYRLIKQREEISPQNWEFIRRLPDCLRLDFSGKKFYFTHSLPSDCCRYFKRPRDIDWDFLSQFDFFLFGHTHNPLIRNYKGVYLINPGSVGQPRDFSLNPSFAIIDPLNNFFALHQVSVDFASYQGVLREKGFDPISIEIIGREKK